MIDYNNLGLKIGLEIHQQLDTGKLFCKCPCIIKDDTPDFEVKRKLRVSASELGETDPAALYELKKEKYFVYQGYNENTCLVEVDELPPEEVNKEALDLTLQVALLLNAKVVDNIQFMRKIVIDGSNVSGFQRTALVAVNGYIETSEGKISIPSICLEEDACKKVEDTEQYRIYNLSRLGIPLIEIATGPEIKSPEGAKEAAEKLGMILRSVKGIKRGLGTIRQDINLSIKGLQRVELKGFQDLRSIPKVVEYEINRHFKLMEINEKLKGKKFEEYYQDVTDIFKNTNCKLVKNVLDKNGRVFGARLNGFNGLLGVEFYANRRFGTELSDYAKVFGVGGIIHSDENLSKYNFSDKEILDVRSKLNIQKDDAFILVTNDMEKARKAIVNAIYRSSIQYIKGVPGEVRKVNEDFSSSFLRPMPGSARMYPETDIPLVYVSKDKLSKIELPKLLDEKIDDLEEVYGINSDIARELIKQEIDIEHFVSMYRNLDASFIARVLIEVPKEVKSRLNLDVSKLKEDNFHAVLQFINDGDIGKEAALNALADLVRDGKIHLEKYKGVSDKELELEVKKIVEANKTAPFGGLMGEVMAKFRGKADGKKVAELIRKYMK